MLTGIDRAECSSSGRYGVPSSSESQLIRDLSTGHHRPAALFLDAAGTFLIPSEPVADVYLRYGAPRGVTLDAQQVLQRFRSAYNDPWSACPSLLRCSTAVYTLIMLFVSFVDSTAMCTLIMLYVSFVDSTSGSLLRANTVALR
jgi:hypothetical protein